MFPAARSHQISLSLLSSAQLKSLSLEDLGEVEIRTVSKQPEEAWQTAAAVFLVTHISCPMERNLELSAIGRKQLQARHQEITGDNGNSVAITREVLAGLSWVW